MYHSVIIIRFSDVLVDISTLLPDAVHERDPTVDYQVHEAALNTMATCHSLRVVDDELLGDPLDVKMFEFTGWSFEEFVHEAKVNDQDDDQNRPLSIAKAPFAMECGIDELARSKIVGLLTTKYFQMLTHWPGRMHKLS